MNQSLIGKRVLVTGAGQGGRKWPDCGVILTLKGICTVGYLLLRKSWKRRIPRFIAFYRMSKKGIGRELAKTLAKFGSKVTALSKGESELVTLKQEVPDIVTIVKDVTDSDIKEVLTKYGPFDGLVNNAGLAMLEPFLEATESSFDISFDVNVKAPFRISQIVASQMIRHNIKGSIVNMSSQASKVALRDHAVYCSTKAALDAMTKVMALELGEYGIRLNCINPTVVMTNMGKIGWSDPKKAGPLLQRIPLRRFAEVEEVVNAILFLLSDESSFINSVTLPVDGGFLSS